MNSLYVIFALIIIGVGIIVVFYLSYKSSKELPKEKSKWYDSDWNLTNFTLVSDMFTKPKSTQDIKSWNLPKSDDSIKEADATVEDIIKDLKLFEAYYHEIPLQKLIVFSAAYILNYKVHHRTADSYISKFKSFDFVPPARTSDQLSIFMSSVSDNERHLLSNLIERKLYKFHKINHHTYEDMMVNISLKLLAQAR